MTPKMPGKFEERDILFAHVIENANRSNAFVRKPDDLSPRSAELALQGLHQFGRGVKMPLKKSLQDFHESICQLDGLPTKIPLRDSFKDTESMSVWSAAVFLTTAPTLLTAPARRRTV